VARELEPLLGTNPSLLPYSPESMKHELCEGQIHDPGQNRPYARGYPYVQGKEVSSPLLCKTPITTRANLMAPL
jgi:hypothetical protein